MPIKRRLCAALFVMVTQACISQTTTPEILTTSGGYQSNASASLSWTLGEPIIETGNSPSNFLTQGFQQPADIIITTVDNTQNPKGNVTAYPNPASSLIYVSGTSNQPMLAEVYDLTGQMVCKKTISTEDNSLNVGNLSNSIYLLKVFTTEGKLLQTLKIDKIK